MKTFIQLMLVFSCANAAYSMVMVAVLSQQGHLWGALLYALTTIASTASAAFFTKEVTELDE